MEYQHFIELFIDASSQLSLVFRVFSHLSLHRFFEVSEPASWTEDEIDMVFTSPKACLYQPFEHSPLALSAVVVYLLQKQYGLNLHCAGIWTVPPTRPTITNLAISIQALSLHQHRPSKASTLLADTSRIYLQASIFGPNPYGLHFRHS